MKVVKMRFMSSSRDVDSMYEKLLSHYRNTMISGEAKLTHDIKSLMKKGLSREEAIRSLYINIFGSPLQRAELAVEKPSLDLELKKLRQRGRLEPLAFLFFVALIPILLLSPALAMFFFIMLIIAFLVSQTAEISWSYSEIFRFPGDGIYLNAAMRELPNTYQEVVLENITSKIIGNTLLISFSAGTLVKENVGESTTTEYADLGPFVIRADFSAEDGDLKVKATYNASIPRKYTNVASELFEKYIVGFRVALRKTLEKVKPKVTLQMDFEKLVSLLEEKGIIVKEVKCPRCGAPIKLPKKGTLTTCPYCGATLTVYDVFKIVKETLSEIKIE